MRKIIKRIYLVKITNNNKKNYIHIKKRLSKNQKKSTEVICLEYTDIFIWLRNLNNNKRRT